MYTGIFPFKRDGTYWAAIDSPAHKRVLAFGSFDNLKLFLEKGEFQNGTLINLRPYTLIQLKYDDALFAGKKQSLFGFAKKGQQQTSLPDYPSGLLDNFRDGQPLSEEELRQCQFYMGIEKAQTVAEGLEERLQHKFSDEEKQTIVTALGCIPIKNGVKNGNGHEKHNEAYGILPNMADMYARLATLPNRAINDLVNAYLAGLAENGAIQNGNSYKAAMDYISRPFIRFIVNDLSKNGATQVPKNGIMNENTLPHPTTSDSYHSLPIALVVPLVYSVILHALNLSRGEGFDDDAGLDGLDLPQPDEIKVPVKHGLDAIARMAKKLTGRIGTGLPPKPFG